MSWPDPDMEALHARLSEVPTLAELMPVWAPIPGHGQATATTPTPSNADARSKNSLRPQYLDSMVGQHRLRSMLRRVIDAALASQQPLDHMLLVAASGTGKSTVANIVANELAVAVYQVEAPVSHDTLLALREVMRDGDVLFIDEVHQQAIMERRGKSSATQPEVLFNVMEDRTIVTATGVLDFPAITVIAATTDEGQLPDPFVNRFPLRPVIEPYTVEDLTFIAHSNANAMGCLLTDEAAAKFAGASRGVPRVVNNYIKNGGSLSVNAFLDGTIAEEVLHDLNGVTDDGLTTDMQNLLTFLYTRAKRTTMDGDVSYQASVGTIATAIGKSRDQKAVQLRIEPFLIEKGYLQVGHGGRSLTDAGIKRAKELLR